MVKQEETMEKKMRVCASCGINRDDCKFTFEKLWMCTTCTDGAMPKSTRCKMKQHHMCETEACYCDCHPENNE